MKKGMRIVLVMVLVVLLVPGWALAAGKKQIQKVDLGKMTCQEFLQEAAADPSGETAGYLLMWLDGYLSGLSGDTVLDGKVFEEFSRDIADLCAKNPDANLLKGARQVGLGK